MKVEVGWIVEVSGRKEDEEEEDTAAGAAMKMKEET